jgi:Uri superfamily endonuclease
VLPREKGTYVLVLRLAGPVRLEVGRLGTFDLSAGFYAYVGSAFGPGGLAARVAHHLRVAERPRWHVDHLRRVAEPVAVWHTTDLRRLEHEWAAELAKRLTPSVPGFGASDCRCPTHLFFARRQPREGSFRFVNASPSPSPIP